MLAPVTIALIVSFVVLVIIAFVANIGARRKKAEVRRFLDELSLDYLRGAPTRLFTHPELRRLLALADIPEGSPRQIATLVVQVVLSVVVAGGSVYLLLTGKGSDADRSAFFALLGGVVGYWLRT